MEPSPASPLVPSTTHRDFRSLGQNLIPAWMVNQLEQMGVLRPSMVQAAVIPEALRGRDIVACAPTGHGKTLCYVVPVLMSVASDPSAYHCIVMVPSRELAVQVKEVFLAVARSAAGGGATGQPIKHLRTQIVIGGEPLADQMSDLRKTKPHVIIATPGRLAQIIRLDMSSPTPLGLNRVRFLVLDEADRLLSSEFAEDIGTIINAVPKPPFRKTFLLSATMTKNIQKIASIGMSEDQAPFSYDENAATQTEAPEGDGAAASSTTPETKAAWKLNSNIAQSYCFMPDQVKDCYLVYLIRSFLGIKASSKLDKDTTHSSNSDSKKGKKHGKNTKEATVRVNTDSQIIVFVRSCQSCEEIYFMLQELEIPSARLHSWMKQADRKSSLEKFRSGLAAVLVATDLAHRGLDIQQVRLVVQYNLPRTTTEYVHRIGRTGRGPVGSAKPLPSSAVCLVDQYDVQLLLNIETDLNIKLPEHETKEPAVLAHLNDSLQARELAKLRLDENGFYEKLQSKQKAKRERQYDQDDAPKSKRTKAE